MSEKIALLLADGFEEIEAVTPVDVLRRLGLSLATVGVSGSIVVGSHNIPITTDITLQELNSAALDAVILPGGLPGATNLRDNPEIISLLKAVHESGGLVCAICAAPIALARAGLTTGKNVTGYPMPMIKDALADANYTGAPTERDGQLITGRGPGAAFEFSIAIANALGYEAQAEELMKAMLVNE